MRLDLSLSFVEALYADYLRDPGSVSSDWQALFAELAKTDRFAARPQLGPSFPPGTLWNPPANDTRAATRAAEAATTVPVDAALQSRLEQLIRAYRVRGHRAAHLDPLAIAPPPDPPEMDPAFYGFTSHDLERAFTSETLTEPKTRTLREVLQHLRNTYCRRIGVQFMHIDDLGTRRWLQERMESSENRLSLSRQQQLRIFTRLTDAALFEEFIQKKFIGAKSFSLEGAESLIPLLELALEAAGEQGIERCVVGMAHRGRLNVLANIIGKSPRLIFREFEDRDFAENIGRGDVKYHLGFNGSWTTGSGKQIELYLCFNPSHLEYVNPVAMGRLRAKMDRAGDRERRHGLCILIHGDAAFIGEGIVQETLNLSELPGYSIGGTLHLIVNNQIGFTTSPHQGRSSTYASDVAKMLQVPVFHVNGEDPEAVAQVIKLACEFRRAFHRDVVIDMYAYRRRGHNEGDEPTFTQPLMYQAIAARPSVRESYLQYLLQLGQVARSETDEIEQRRREYLEQELSVARAGDVKLAWDEGRHWTNYRGGREADLPEPSTGVAAERLTELGLRLTLTPQGFQPHPKIEKLHQVRAAMARGEKPLDWAMAEMLAYASLVADGRRLRLTGQDCERGTFGHRHAVLHDHATGLTFMPLGHLAPEQGAVEIYNSPLSENGVMGFEYGYSLDAPEALVIWEAQFGDFSNCAQVIIDQFISSGEEKWRRLSGLVLLLPHGFEGQGPEHSSARLERFLSLAATDNLQIAQPTTPAQYFHLLRRQVLRPWRKPLIVMTPKSLLRHPAAVSTLDELANGRFHRLLADRTPSRSEVTRVLLCSGKIAYELEKRREEANRWDVAVLRVEQLYPLPDDQLAAALAPYRAGIPVYWVQDEPANMGAWPFLRLRHGMTLVGRHPFDGISRPNAASPATGSASSHRYEQEQLLTRAFGEPSF